MWINRAVDLSRAHQTAKATNVLPDRRKDDNLSFPTKAVYMKEIESHFWDESEDLINGNSWKKSLAKVAAKASIKLNLIPVSNGVLDLN